MPSKPQTVLNHIKNLKNRNHSQTFLQFYDYLTEIESSSDKNAANYLSVLKMYSESLGKIEIDKVTRENIIDFLNTKKKSSEQDPEQKWVRTWNDYLARLIGFYKWLKNSNSKSPRKEWDTPEPIKNIKPKKNTRESSYSPNDVWTQDELILILKYVEDIRDKTILTLLWDLASRNHELVKLRIRDILFSEKYAEISTSWNTKTGKRTNPSILSFPYLRDLINIHPFSNDPNAFLILSKTSQRPLTPNSLWTLTNTVKSKIAKMYKEDKIKGEDKQTVSKLLQKPWNPYLIGRHSSITEKTDMLKDYQLKQFAGWTINSKRAVTYIHRNGKQVINPLLEEYGIKPKDKPKTKDRECSKCGFVNVFEASICVKCNFVLDMRGWENQKIEEEQSQKDARLEIQALRKENESTNKRLDKIEKLLGDSVENILTNIKKEKKFEKKLD